MAASTVEALLVTANVGSIFEDTVSLLNPTLVALHCQEVGGKNYERSMQHVTDFVKLLMSSEELQHFDKVRIYLDEDYSSAEHFTALGNFYFIHESISEGHVEVFDFEESKFTPVVGKEIHSGNIESVPTKEKSKFPQEIFPECKWSRKGFMRTRWNINGTVFDLINIHLFHDASNFVAMESFPSVYCKNRQRALEHTLKRFHTDQYGTVPFFVFGDFNFRTDTQGVVKKLAEGLNAISIQSSKSTDPSKLQYRDESSQQVVLTLGKKEFSHQDHQNLFLGEDREWLKEFDKELESFEGQLYEFAISFPPTYPYVEDSERGEMYMQTRCPSWCDRVFLSSSARALVNHVDGEPCVQYGLIGQNSCMGDHKPVFLLAALVGGIGTVSCCAVPATPCTSRLCATSPVEHFCRLCSEQPVGSSFPLFDEPDEQDNNGLRVPTFHHHSSPYTPDSTDTEPDIPEDLSPSENIDFKGKKLQTMPSQRVVSDLTSLSGEEQKFWRDSFTRKSSSKIPQYIRPEKKDDAANTLKMFSKIPVLKSLSSSTSTDSQKITLKDAKGKNVKGLSLTIPCPLDSLQTKVLSEEVDNTFISTSSELITSIIHSSSSTPQSLIPKLRSVDGRKVLARQKNVEELSSDSDPEDSKKFYDESLNDQEEAKVEIQLSLVESSPVSVSRTDCEQNTFLNTDSTGDTVGLRGSATDSGVSVSPDLSVAASSLTDSPGKMTSNSNMNIESNEDREGKAVNVVSTPPLSLERFSLVRRIQSASAMERKSSFPLPSSTLAENRSSLSGLSGSNSWGMRTCRCMSDGSWRQRSATVSHSLINSRTDSRIRIISVSSNLDRSLPRLQSHHSSSEEDWFEEVNNDINNESEPSDTSNSNGVDVKNKTSHVAERVKRLSTHTEDVIKPFDSTYSIKNDSSSVLVCDSAEKGNTIIDVLQQSVDSAQQSFQISTDTAIAYVGSTLAQTCLVDTERVPADVSILDAGRRLETDVESPFDSGLSFKRVENSESAPTCQVDSDDHEINHLQPRKSLHSVKENKVEQDSSCKACCTLL